ncbi:hypothetical protein FH972_024595 [Carpinus fangiana]|uniref:SEP domain-containing protein n=1 Tax=Carpinus fangiana TaxID=176857 RepID=A0A5N6KYS6_9ROSI|nr:hypothetical protein FH972_024595 [Carpinus fangiana]
MAEDRDTVIAKFCELTAQDEQVVRGAIWRHLEPFANRHQQATEYLGANQWNLDAATQSFFEDQDPDEEDEAGAAGPVHGQGPILGSSNPVGASSSRPPAQKKKFGSLKDLTDNGSDGNSHGDDDDSDKEQQYFAGGDKSGLAVQDPGQGSRDHIKRILETARRHGSNGPLPRPDDGPQQSAFRGSGVTLGGDDTPSQTIPDTTASQPQPLPMAERTLHLWADGFSVDDGPLFRYDDPANARTLEMINRGSAPLDLMNVENGQAVDVKLEQHQNENYVQPKKKWKPFSGSGQRLGSPTPGPSGTSSAPAAAPAAAPVASTSNAGPPTVEGLDEGQPFVTLQIRLADGTRLPSRTEARRRGGSEMVIAKAPAAVWAEKNAPAMHAAYAERVDERDRREKRILRRTGLERGEWCMNMRAYIDAAMQNFAVSRRSGRRDQASQPERRNCERHSGLDLRRSTPIKGNSFCAIVRGADWRGVVNISPDGKCR